MYSQSTRGRRSALATAALNQSYWVLDALLGSVAGSLLSFNTTGIDFVMTALFTVIFIDQWQSSKGHTPALVDIGSTVVCLVVCLLMFQAEHFILPSMILILCILTGMRTCIEQEEDAKC